MEVVESEEGKRVNLEVKQLGLYWTTVQRDMVRGMRPSIT